MNEIRKKTEEISIKQYYLENLADVLANFVYGEYQNGKDSRLDTLVTIVLEKIRALNTDLDELYKMTFRSEEK